MVSGRAWRRARRAMVSWVEGPQAEMGVPVYRSVAMRSESVGFIAGGWEESIAPVFVARYGIYLPKHDMRITHVLMGGWIEEKILEGQ